MTTKKTDTPEDNLLHQLLNTCSPSGREKEAAEVFRRWLEHSQIPIITDALGNVLGCINPTADVRILIAAHADEIGLQITHISPEGLLFFRRVGGIEVMSLCGHRVVILGRKGPVNGIIGRNAQNYNLTEKGIDFALADLWIDIGAESKEETLQWVEIGDFVSFEPNFQLLGNHKICAKGIDNKIGLFIISQVVNRLKDVDLSIGIYIAASVQEEISTKGIASCAHIAHPQIGFIVDVGFATDIPQTSPIEAKFDLGKGAGIILNADNNADLVKYISEVAHKQHIPLQKTVGHKLTGGTDAAGMQLADGKIATANISIPCRYMHSHTEICDKRDIESAVQLLSKVVLQLNTDYLSKTTL